MSAWELGGAALYQGDVLEVLAGMGDESVNCVVTSPPYWGLRDYGTGTWEGGDPECDHQVPKRPERTFADGRNVSGKSCTSCTSWTHRDCTTYKDTCGKCGARRVDRQLGLEPTVQEYVEKMVAVFREVRRVLRADGTCWVNMGDCYATGVGKVGDHPGGGSQGERWKSGYKGNHADDPKRAKVAAHIGPMTQPNRMPQPGLKPKDLVGLPWRVAFALQADGWWLRSDIIWHKPNPMPESVRDRPTRAHEYIFLLTKSAKYWYDNDAVKEPGALDTVPRYRRGRSDNHKWGDGGPLNQTIARTLAHMVSEAPEIDLLFGMDEEHGRDAHAPLNGTKRDKQRGHSRPHDGFNDRWDGMTKAEQCAGMRNLRDVWTHATCPYPGAHFATYPPELVLPCVLAGCPEGGVVLDPFAGTSATGEAALRCGRRYVGIELNPASIALSIERIGALAGQMELAR